MNSQLNDGKKRRLKKLIEASAEANLLVTWALFKFREAGASAA